MTAICKGSIALGTACRKCEKCEQEMKNMMAGIESSDEPEFEWGDHYWTEGLDRILNTSNIAHCMLVDHPAIDRAGMKEDVEAIVATLDELYQKLADSIPDEEW